MIYLDSGATSFYRPPQVIDAVSRAMKEMGNASRGLHGPALLSGRMIFETRQLLSGFFGAEGPEQVVFTANATQSLNTVIKGLLEPGDRVITTVMEHNSVLRPLYEMEARGVLVNIVGADRYGRLDMEGMRRAITPDVRAVFCTHASNVTGNVNDISKIGGWCREAGVLFVVDGAQTAGILPVNMSKDYIDVFCFSGHKGLMGPQGVGGFCVKKGLTIRPLVTGGSGIKTFDKEQPGGMPEALEAGTLNSHGIAGLKAGLEYILDTGIDNIREQEQELAWNFYDQIRKIQGIKIYGDFSDRNRVATVALNLADEDSGQAADWLYENYGICARPGGHCAPLMHRTFGTEKQGIVRFSFSCFNKTTDIMLAAKALGEYL